MLKVEVPVGLFGSSEPFFQETIGGNTPQCRMERIGEKILRERRRGSNKTSNAIGDRIRRRRAENKQAAKEKKGGEIVNKVLESAISVNNLVQGKNQFGDAVDQVPNPSPKNAPEPEDNKKKIIIAVAAVAGVALLGVGIYYLSR